MKLERALSLALMYSKLRAGMWTLTGILAVTSLVTMMAVLAILWPDGPIRHVVEAVSEIGFWRLAFSFQAVALGLLMHILTGREKTYLEIIETLERRYE